MQTFTPSLDFETYSEAGFQQAHREWITPGGKPRSELVWTGTEPGSKKNGLPLVGARNYIEHPTFGVLCMAYSMRPGDVQLWLPGCEPPHELLQHVARGGPLQAWNASFEWQVWSIHCTPRYGWPKLLLSQMRCSMARSAANGFPRGLDDAGGVLSLHTHRAAPEPFNVNRPNVQHDATSSPHRNGCYCNECIPF
jgi:hypothetical protein